ncbi:MAG: glycine--tRNA ligase subunit beta [Pseudomonadota bacterium]
MPELLLESFSEEIPARMQAAAASQLERSVNQNLLDAGFLPEAVKSFYGPRRLVVVVTGLPVQQSDTTEEKKGPRVGAPEKAVAGFLKSAGLTSLEECETREDKKGSFYVAVKSRKGRPTADLIAEFLPAIVNGFQWPKSMRWGDGQLRWVRPLRRILCVFDGEVVPFEIDGTTSGDTTEGHRTMSSGAIQVRSFEAYAEKLAAAKVRIDPEDRRELIAQEAKTLCEAQGMELVEDPVLLNELTGLAEWPIPLIGSFDEQFLSVPDEVLTASMRTHQKYFSVRSPKTGTLANRFVCVANIEAPDGGAAMRVGYERVLAARLSDAWYLYQQDLKTPLEARVAELDGMTFFEGLGTVGDKAKRLSSLAGDIANATGADASLAKRAGLLAKADLVTGMVTEFPSLQGVMGGYYASAQGEPGDVVEAIRDHYRPAGAEDSVPTAAVTVAVALADKLDSLTSFWSIGKKPTGSSDPFALRRAALGVIRIILANKIRLPLPEDGDLLAFFHDRLKVYLKEQGRRRDHIDAVLNDKNGKPCRDLVTIINKLEALEAFLTTGSGGDLVAAYKRASNILAAEEKNAAPAGGGEVDTALLDEPAEKELATVMADAAASIGGDIQGERYQEAMAQLSRFRTPLDEFFETVKVNADDDAVRRNRLAILSRLVDQIERVADFSKVEAP